MCSYEGTTWLGSWDFTFSKQDLGKWAGNLPYKDFSRDEMKGGWIWAARMASSCITCCIFEIISIPCNCIDTALRVPKAIIGAKGYIFFPMFALLFESWVRTRPQDLWPFLIPETELKFLIWTQGEIGNRAHVEKPLNLNKCQPFLVLTLITPLYWVSGFNPYFYRQNYVQLFSLFDPDQLTRFLNSCHCSWLLFLYKII